jgi:UDP-N-acetylmuramoyl-tripeptide--D-alanyl-D-alanine ligase
MKKPCLTLEDFFQLNGSVLYNPEKIKTVTKVTIDSRNVPAGSLFVAIKGEKFDGHDFINDALKKGAAAIIINKSKLSAVNLVNIPIIAVEDTTKALGELALMWRKKLRTKIIAITGSAGKTTTKEMIFTLLSGKFKTNKTLGNNNNHIGVPLTIFSTTNKHDYLVLELGTNHFGEISYTAKIAMPDFAVITNIGNSHLEFLKSKNGVYREKASLFDEAIRNKGTIFINNDDESLFGAKKNYTKRITYGFSRKASIQGKLLGYSKDYKPIICVRHKNKVIKIKLPFYGNQNAKNFLVAWSIALNRGLNQEEIENRIKKFKQVEKRLNVQKFKDSVLINDTYNANPDSMNMSLQLLSQIGPNKNRVAILGDMFELGKHSKELHEKLADVIFKNKISSVYTIGNMMEYLHQKLLKKKIEAIHFDERKLLIKYLTNKVFTNSVVLVKGSRGMKMEEFIDKIFSKKNWSKN